MIITGIIGQNWYTICKNICKKSVFFETQAGAMNLFVFCQKFMALFYCISSKNNHIYAFIPCVFRNIFKYLACKTNSESLYVRVGCQKTIVITTSPTYPLAVLCKCSSWYQCESFFIVFKWLAGAILSNSHYFALRREMLSEVGYIDFIGERTVENKCLWFLCFNDLL